LQINFGLTLQISTILEHVVIDLLPLKE